jgi:UDP:flavonoid glycosyltransferase YjiC (YdhE family)
VDPVTSRFLFAAWPFEGHLYPQMSVARVLRERGHDVAFYSGEAMRPATEREGFRLYPFQRVDESRWLRVHETESKARGRRESLRADYQAFREWFVETIPDQVADLEEIMREWKPDVLVVDNSMWGPIVILREAVPMPVVAWCLMGTVIPGPDAPPWGFGFGPPRTRLARARASLFTGLTNLAATGVRRRVNEFRAGNGLPPIVRSLSAFAAESSL